MSSLSTPPTLLVEYCTLYLTCFGDHHGISTGSGRIRKVGTEVHHCDHCPQLFRYMHQASPRREPACCMGSHRIASAPCYLPPGTADIPAFENLYFTRMENNKSTNLTININSQHTAWRSRRRVKLYKAKKSLAIECLTIQLLQFRDCMTYSAFGSFAPAEAVLDLASPDGCRAELTQDN